MPTVQPLPLRISSGAAGAARNTSPRQTPSEPAPAEMAAGPNGADQGSSHQPVLNPNPPSSPAPPPGTESKRNPDRSRPDDAAWLVSGGTRRRAREADACMAADDWLYAAPVPPPPAGFPLTGRITLPQTPSR